MNYLEIMIIAVALSMDAFAVSISMGLSVEKPKAKHFLIPGFYFGFFQALMPFIGYFAGTFFVERIQHLDHWVAFILLGIIGGKMIKDSLQKSEEKTDINGGSCKTSVLRELPLKNACFAACEPKVRWRETARASAKLTEFCKKLILRKFLAEFTGDFPF